MTSRPLRDFEAAPRSGLACYYTHGHRVPAAPSRAVPDAGTRWYIHGVRDPMDVPPSAAAGAEALAVLRWHRPAVRQQRQQATSRRPRTRAPGQTNAHNDHPQYLGCVWNARSRLLSRFHLIDVAKLSFTRNQLYRDIYSNTVVNSSFFIIMIIMCFRFFYFTCNSP